MAILTSFA